MPAAALVSLKASMALGAVIIYLMSLVNPAGGHQRPQVTGYYDAGQAIVFEVKSGEAKEEVKVNKDGKCGEVKIKYKRGIVSFDFETAGELDPKVREHIGEIVGTICKYIDNRSFSRKVGDAVKSRIGGYLKKIGKKIGG